MRKELSDLDLDNVTGGEVILDNPHKVVGFTTTKEMYSLNLPTGTTFLDVVNYKNQLLMENADMTDAAFDALVKSKFQEKGWIEF